MISAVTLLLKKLLIVVEDAVNQVLIVDILLHGPPILEIIVGVNAVTRVPSFRQNYPLTITLNVKISFNQYFPLSFLKLLFQNCTLLKYFAFTATT